MVQVIVHFLLTGWIVRETSLIFSETSDLVLITVDRASLVTFYDGSVSLESSEPSRRRNSGSNVIGMHWRDVWCDKNMNEAVRKMLEEETVRSSHREHFILRKTKYLTIPWTISRKQPG